MHSTAVVRNDKTAYMTALKWTRKAMSKDLVEMCHKNNLTSAQAKGHFMDLDKKIKRIHAVLKNKKQGKETAKWSDFSKVASADKSGMIENICNNDIEIEQLAGRKNLDMWLVEMEKRFYRELQQLQRSRQHRKKESWRNQQELLWKN